MPTDGVTDFEVPYTLPTSFDATTWFASGWRGVSYLQIQADRYNSSATLAHCKLTFETFVTQSNDEDWQTLPSAAVATISLLSIIAAMLMCICCLACRPSRKQVTDDAYFGRKEDPVTAYRNMEEAREKEEEQETEENAEKAFRISKKMKYPKQLNSARL